MAELVKTSSDRGLKRDGNVKSSDSDDRVNEMLLCKRYEDEKATTCSQIPASFWNQFTTILARMFIQIYRNKVLCFHFKFKHLISHNFLKTVMFRTYSAIL